jgi:uncharacterized membrane protein HdeD (DUF308 family)
MKKKDKDIVTQDKDSRRSDLNRDFVGYLLLVALGCLLFFRPDFGSAAVATVLGWIAIAIGGIMIFVCLLSWPVLGIPQLLTGIAAVGFGVYILLNPLMLASIFGIAVGIYLVFQGFVSILEGNKLRKLGHGFSASLIIGLIMLVVGFVLIFAPLTSSRLVMMLIGICMVLCGGVRLLLRAVAARKLSHPKEDPDIIDADE